MSTFDKEYRHSKVNEWFTENTRSSIEIQESDDLCVFDPMGRLYNSKLAFIVNNTAVCDSNASSAIWSQVLQFLTGSDFPTPLDVNLCNTNMKNSPFRDGDWSHNVPPWRLEELKWDQLFGPMCPRCNYTCS